MPRKILTQAHGAQCFWVNNGPIIRDLEELKRAVDEMSDEKFDYHTKREGNDFAEWVEKILGEKSLAKKLERTRTRKGFVKAIGNYLS